MCKIGNISAEFKKIDFDRRGYITFHLQDGRIIYAPLKNFPDIKKLSKAKREKWTILDGQYFTFIGEPEIYSITDILSLNPS